MLLECAEQSPGSCWTYIVGQDPSDSEADRLHVDIFRFSIIHLRYILSLVGNIAKKEP
jgi:hypothetical protein